MHGNGIEKAAMPEKDIRRQMTPGAGISIALAASLALAPAAMAVGMKSAEAEPSSGNGGGTLDIGLSDAIYKSLALQPPEGLTPEELEEWLREHQQELEQGGSDEDASQKDESQEDASQEEASQAPEPSESGESQGSSDAATVPDNSSTQIPPSSQPQTAPQTQTPNPEDLLSKLQSQSSSSQPGEEETEVPAAAEMAPEDLSAAKDDSSAAADLEEAEDDIEACLWEKDGYNWSTTRGGSLMRITDAFAMGIDVSEWQSHIDWARVKAAGVDYAILRCAYGSDASGHEDYRFAEYVRGCRENGIPFGVYLYSNSSTTEGAAREAQFAIDVMQRAGVTPDDLAFPVYYDIEDEVHVNMSSESLGDLAEAFCNEIADAGYVPGIYSSQSWFSSLLTDDRFGQWTKWVASYPAAGEDNAKTGYTGQHDMWQCMSRGIIDGISTRVDIDFDYRFTEEQYSDIYNYDYYLEKNADLSANLPADRRAVLDHFLTSGMSEGRDSSPTFKVHGYYNANADLRDSFGLNLEQYYLHYMSSGRKEGRSVEDSMVPKDLVRGYESKEYAEVYDPYVYLSNNPDLRDAYTIQAQGYVFIDDAGLFDHYIENGQSEGRISK